MVAYTGALTFHSLARCADYTPGIAVSAGDLVSQGKLVGVAIKDLEASVADNIELEGIYAVDKESTSHTYTAGQDVYWDATNERATATPTLTYLGEAIAAATATATKVYVRLKGRVNLPQPFGVINETISIADFTDNAGTATGYCDLGTDLPAGALVLAWRSYASVGFAGDTTAVIYLGVNGDTDRFSALKTSSCLTAADAGGSQAPASGANAYCSVATTPRVTIEGASDFTSIVSNGAGTVQITLLYVMLPLAA